MEGKGGVSVVVPVFNGEAALPELAGRVTAVLEARGEPYEILFVNDGSRDASWSTICELAAASPVVAGLDLMRNYGQHNALLVGVRAARYEVVVTLDDDLQNPPEEIPRLLGELTPGIDVVYGVPSERADPRWRGLGAWLIRALLATAMGLDLARKVSSFRAFRTELREAFAEYRGSFVSIDVLLTWGSNRRRAVLVDHHPRRTGRSNYRLVTLLAHALDVTTGFSTRPLRFASLIGFALTLFGVGVLGWVVGRYLWLGYSVPGFPFLASVIAIFSGAQLFALGIMGEYIARIHFRNMGVPFAAVRSRTGGEDPGAEGPRGGKTFR